MKFAAVLALLPLIALAAPMDDGKHVPALKRDDDKYDDKHDDKYEDKHDDDDGKCDAFPFEFTSTLVAYANPNEIINNNQTSVPGLPGGSGTFKFGLNSKEDYICWSISVYIKGNYSSPARTATHIHEAVKGKAGPPRIAFSNPTSSAPIDEFSWRHSAGCQKGPFTTGVVANGADTGAGFTIAKLEANPSGFFADTHTAEFLPGAIRGQIQTR